MPRESVLALVSIKILLSFLGVSPKNLGYIVFKGDGKPMKFLVRPTETELIEGTPTLSILEYAL